MGILLEERLEKELNRRIEIDKLLAEKVFILSYILESNLSTEVDKGNIIKTLLKKEPV